MRLDSNFRFRLAAHRGVLCAWLAVAGVSAVAAEPPTPNAVIGVDEIVFDHSQVEWSETYLQWIATFVRGSSPISDTSGALCAAKQDGDVWFLATSDGTAPVVRACVVPVGRTLFVPIAGTMERSGNKEPDCESMARIAAGTLTQHVGEMSMTIDGQRVDNLASHRIATGECFALGLRQTPRSTARTAVADGYYVMLRPLEPGAHTISVGAKFDSTSLSTTYRLDVR